ncbi:hypothetical protein GTP44_07535 [Duganella sp. FT50W]|uniref:Uncharacterized protein n=1 Tax=Duganella lactea TaxID=2692173 RepID=A0A6L8MH76_9BURK|nr:hypothetical protein [Duganella lactea]MYM81809.1 hypothetical protein [Duganella lactea]
MKRGSKLLPLVLWAAALVSLSGCGPSPLLRVTNAAINMGQGLPDEMLNTHLAGIVAFDEMWADEYGRVARNQLYTQGIERGKPEYNLRVVRINLSNTGSALWIAKGELAFPTGAIVPDHMPQLHAGDVVEIRQTASWMSMENFSVTGEGNIVVRVLCYAADSTYKACVDKTPKTGRIAGFGFTNTPFPASVRGYGFTFTPMFDEQGRALRRYPAEQGTRKDTY